MSVKPALSVSKALSAALSFVPRAWAGAWLVLILSALIGPATHLLMMQQWPQVRLIHFVSVMLRLLLMLMAWGAMYRLALFGREARGEGLGLGGIQIGRPELRLLLARIAIGLFVLMVMATLFIVFAVAFNTSGMANGYENTLTAVCAMLKRHSSVADYVFIGYLLASVIFMVFVGLKFSLMNAAIIAERRLVALNALGLTSGHVGKLFVGLMAIILPKIVGWIVILHLLGPKIRFAHAWPHAASTYGLHAWVHGLLSMVIVFILWPLIVGFFASAYSQIVAIRSK